MLSVVIMRRPSPTSTLLPCTTLFRSLKVFSGRGAIHRAPLSVGCDLNFLSPLPAICMTLRGCPYFLFSASLCILCVSALSFSFSSALIPRPSRTSPICCLLPPASPHYSPLSPPAILPALPSPHSPRSS